MVGIFLKDQLSDVFAILLFLLMISGPVAWLALAGRGNTTFMVLGILSSLAIFAWLWNDKLLLSGLWSLLIPTPLLVNVFIRNHPDYEELEDEG